MLIYFGLEIFCKSRASATYSCPFTLGVDIFALFFPGLHDGIDCCTYVLDVILPIFVHEM